MSDDRQPTRQQQAGAGVAAVQRRAPARQAQHHRQHEIVGHHDRQGDGFDHDHGGRRGQAADHGEEGDKTLARRDRQRDHREIAVEGVGKGEQAGDGQRHHEQVDGDEIEREDEGGGADVVLVVVLDDGDMELARQEQHGAAGQQRERRPHPGVGRRRRSRREFLGRSRRGGTGRQCRHTCPRRRRRRPPGRRAV